MKILALNGSPKGKLGNTEVMLVPFLEGCKEAGAEVETVYLKEKEIKHCSGCFSCWSKTPGKCIHKDDMEELLIKVSEADIIVHATPLYYYTVTGITKDFLDRQLPLIKGNIVKSDDHYVHPWRNKEKGPAKTVLISNCGFPGNNNFSGLLETFKVMCKKNLAGTIVLGQGGMLTSISKNDYLREAFKPFASALKNAGKEIVNFGYITAETQAVFDKDIIDPEMYSNPNTQGEK